MDIARLQPTARAIAAPIVAIIAAATPFLPAPRALAQPGFVNWESAHVSPLALTPSGSTLLAVNTADSRLEVFDVSGAAASTPRLLRSIGTGLDPVSVKCRTETEAWVVNQISDSVSIIDLPTARIVRTLFPGDEPADAAFANGRAFITCSSMNQVKVYSLNDLAAAPTTIAIAGSDPRTLLASPDGTRVYVGIFGSGNQTTIVKRQDVSNPVGPYGGQNPPPNSGTAFNPPLAAGLPTPPQVAQIVRRDAAGAWRDDNNRDWSQFVTWNLADNDVAIIDAATLAVTYAKGMLSAVMALGIRPDGVVTPVGLDARNELRFEPNVKSKFVRVQMGAFNPASPAATTLVDLNPHLLYDVASLPQGFRDLSIGDPRAIVWHPTSGRAYVAGMGSNNIIITSAAGTRFGEVNIGGNGGPTGLALSADGARLYTLNKFDGSVSAIDTAANTETARVRFFDPTPPSIKLGRPFLYDTHRTSGLGQASCASCHLDSKADFLAWDLGSPAGAMKNVNATCFSTFFFCAPWHPMKGPMVTQSLQGIVGTEPLHWRGDRENVAAFGPAFTDLQGMDAQPTPAELAQLTGFIASIKYPPNPNRTIADALPASMPTFGNSTGSPSNGASIFQSTPVIGTFTCTTCHTLATGTTGKVDDANTAGVPQSIKMAQLRGLYHKPAFDRSSQQSIRGFGINHDSEFDTIFAHLGGSNFSLQPGPTGEQQKRDLEAFLLCFPGDTHPAVGQQITFDGSNNTDPTLVARLNTFVSLANSATVGIIARGRNAGVSRGWYFTAAGTMQPDRAADPATTVNALRTGAAPGAEITFTVVPAGAQLRMGIDRDGDGYFDGDEIASCANPGDPTSFPGSRANIDVDASGSIAVQDIFAFLNRWFAGDPRADFNGAGGITVQDIFDFLNAWFAGCP
ncbi:MAG TPA: GC-type dockerin domain-anchored protein [Phycisphaerales bacterium]|nr:GC-type dockerin domain-anchored protein [Phycisphaerales bacterium]